MAGIVHALLVGIDNYPKPEHRLSGCRNDVLEFEQLLRGVYCTHGISEEFVRVDPDVACILMDRDAQTWFTLRFASSDRDRQSCNWLRKATRCRH